MATVVQHGGVRNTASNRNHVDTAFALSGQRTLESPMQDPPLTSKSTTSTLDAETYFNSLRSSRTNSVYSFSRMSFSSQLSQLGSLHLPDGATLSDSIASIPAAPVAAKMLSNAAEQISKWLQKASEVLTGLDAEDDVEWAAAGGREGLSEVDAAVTKFENLINAYVTAIENLQDRRDISSVFPKDQKELVGQMEAILAGWDKIRQLLRGVKSQVELAMEWEELWNHVLGDIGNEMESLFKLVFEMEETRHKATMADTHANGTSCIDMRELETIAEESPNIAQTLNHRMSLSQSFGASSPLASPTLNPPQEDATLMELFARMQPLRASLDFLPMRLIEYQRKAKTVLPTGCQELEDRWKSLEKRWQKLERDAENLRKELGEDRWVVVFRNAGRQLEKLCDSIERSITKLQESIDLGHQHSDPPTLAKRIESYETKRTHYGPSVERVLAIIEKGVKDRKTYNGEIIKLQRETHKRWALLEADMKSTDFALDNLNSSRNQQLRDSISTILSTDRSMTESNAATPGSSPASSVAHGPVGGNKNPAPRYSLNAGYRPASSSDGNLPTQPRRHLSQPISSHPSLPRKSLTSRAASESYSPARGVSPSPHLPLRGTRPSLSSQPQGGPPKPRWKSSYKVEHIDFVAKKPTPVLTPPNPSRRSSMSFRSPSAAGTYTPYQTPQNLTTAAPSLPHPRLSGSRTSLGHRQTFSSPLRAAETMPRPTNSRSRTALSHAAETTPRPQNPRSRTALSQLPTPPTSAIRRQSFLSDLDAVPSPEIDGYKHGSVDEDTPSRARPSRPSTSMGNNSNKRTSMLPLPKRELAASGISTPNSGLRSGRLSAMR